MPLFQVRKKIELVPFAMVEVSLCIRKAMSTDPKPVRRSQRIAAKQATMPSTTAAAVCSEASMPYLGVRKHPHIERVYTYDPKHASYMLSRAEANNLGYWEFSEDDWDIIFCGESKVSLGLLCQQMTDQCYRYGGLERAQRSALKIELDEFGCWTCNDFSSTLALSHAEYDALGVFPELFEEEWEWMFCGATKVEVRCICDVLTPAHCKDARRRAEAEVARQELVPPMPLLTPALIRQQAVDQPRLSPEASAWVRSVRIQFTQMPSGKESIHVFIRRCELIADILQSILSSPYFVEVMRDSPKGCGLAKAALQAAKNLTVDGEQKIEKTREELKYYRCPFSLKNQLNRHYKRIQDLSAIMTAIASPYIIKHD